MWSQVDQKQNYDFIDGDYEGIDKGDDNGDGDDNNDGDGDDNNDGDDNDGGDRDDKASCSPLIRAKEWGLPEL